MQSNEDLRQKLNAVIVWLAWTGAGALTMLIVADIVSRDFSVAVVLLLGAGVASGLSRSRYKFNQTITQVFHAGVEAGRCSRNDREDN